MWAGLGALQHPVNGLLCILGGGNLAPALQDNYAKRALILPKVLCNRQAHYQWDVFITEYTKCHGRGWDVSSLERSENSQGGKERQHPKRAVDEQILTEQVLCSTVFSAGDTVANRQW